MNSIRLMPLMLGALAVCFAVGAVARSMLMDPVHPAITFVSSAALTDEEESMVHQEIRSVEASMLSLLSELPSTTLDGGSPLASSTSGVYPAPTRRRNLSTVLMNGGQSIDVSDVLASPLLNPRRIDLQPRATEVLRNRLTQYREFFARIDRAVASVSWVELDALIRQASCECVSPDAWGQLRDKLRPAVVRQQGGVVYYSNYDVMPNAQEVIHLRGFVCTELARELARFCSDHGCLPNDRVHSVVDALASAILANHERIDGNRLPRA